MNKKFAKGIMIAAAALMVGGMAYVFTPMAQNSMGNNSKVALKVDGLPITVAELESTRQQYQQNPAFSVDTGLLADDTKTFLMAQLIREKAMLYGAREVKVTKQDVATEVADIRKKNALEDNKAWTDALAQRGFSDATFRKTLQEQLTIQKKMDELKKAAAAPTEAELQMIYSLNKEKYQSAPRIIGRQIVVADKATAEKALARAKAGENFANLARELSTEFKDRGGALGPIENGQPRPVERAALPSAVADAAFVLEKGGLTDIIESGGKFYIVRVESYLKPAPKAFAEVKPEITKLAKELKENALLEQWVLEQEKNAKLEIVDPAWQYHNPTVATVNGRDIRYAEVIGQALNNPQASMLFSQMPPEQAAGFLNSSLKPSITDQLIQSAAAPAIVKSLGLPLVGPSQTLAMNLMLYGSKDVSVSEADIEKFYQENKEQYGTPASANVLEASFADKNAAMAFRRDWDGQGNFTTAATKAGGTVSERGNVTAGGGTDPKLEAAMFSGSLRGVGEGSLSDVVEVADRYSVAYLKDLQRATTKPLSEVRDSIQMQLLDNKRAEKGAAFLKAEVDKLKVTNTLDKVMADQAARVAAAEPKPEEGAQEGADQDTGTKPAEPAESATPAEPAGAADAGTETAPAEATPTPPTSSEQPTDQGDTEQAPPSPVPATP